MGDLLEKYMAMSDQRQQRALQDENAMEVAPSSVLKPISLSEDSGSTDAPKIRGTKRAR